MQIGELANLLKDSLVKFGFNSNNIVGTVETEIEAFDLIMKNPGSDNIYVLLCQDDAAAIIEKINLLN